uniref:Uncharacterized protein n=1 Tax=Eutreptiella gymnastica TaxID=73025 RepID=A0A6T2ABY6_9EUGL
MAMHVVLKPTYQKATASSMLHRWQMNNGAQACKAERNGEQLWNKQITFICCLHGHWLYPPPTHPCVQQPAMFSPVVVWGWVGSIPYGLGGSMDKTVVSFEAQKSFVLVHCAVKVPQRTLPDDECIDRTQHIPSVAKEKPETCIHVS